MQRLDNIFIFRYLVYLIMYAPPDYSTEKNLIIVIVQQWCYIRLHLVFGTRFRAMQSHQAGRARVDHIKSGT